MVHHMHMYMRVHVRSYRWVFKQLYDKGLVYRGYKVYLSECMVTQLVCVCVCVWGGGGGGGGEEEKWQYSFSCPPFPLPPEFYLQHGAILCHVTVR